MADTYTLILKECPEDARAHVGQFLSKAFSLKDTTCATIAASAPIALLGELSADEAAALVLVMAGIQHPGLEIEFTTQVTDEIPKIDWPKRPLVFKREIVDYVRDFSLPIACADCGQTHPLLDLLHGLVAAGRNTGATSRLYRPTNASARTGPTMAKPPTARNEFRGSNLPEITPFANQALPSGLGHGSSPVRPASSPSASGSNDDPVSRLNELFPDDDNPGFIPDNNDITSILNRLLPDEGQAVNNQAPIPARDHQKTAPTASGFSVFLAKIGDEARRLKAVPLLIELGKITQAEADTLSKKVIIPVLKGVTKDEAEAARQRFAKIGILARVKGAETQG